MEEQAIFLINGDYGPLLDWFAAHRKTMLVCGPSVERLPVYETLRAIPAVTNNSIFRFSDFSPNPAYESVVKGVAAFRAQGCDSVAAVGGGSAMDVAKCILLFSAQPGDGAEGAFLREPLCPRKMPFLAMPTTAGTGSEATSFAVLYYQGQKQSVGHAFCLPDRVILDPESLTSLPAYHRKATMMDALCHAMESYWSLRSTPQSRRLSQEAIGRIMAHKEGYLANTREGNAGMLQAAHIAGQAINIAQTTAGHAMCYKITELFGCAHGHAAALCVRVIYPWMLAHMDLCRDERGREHVAHVLREIGVALGGTDAPSGVEILQALFDSLSLEIPAPTLAQYAALSASVNPDRLKNFPLALDEQTLDKLYHLILR